jgi:DnaD and phage-associated domain/DnaD and phage-associated domain
MQLNMEIDSGLMSTPLPNFFIDNFMVSANPIFSLIYIYLYKNCLYGQKNLTISILAKHFNIIESDIFNALKYWQEKNLIEYETKNDVLFVKFIYPKFSSNSEIIFTKKSDVPNFFSFPSYTIQELNLYRDNPKIKELFDFAQDSLGRYLTYSDLNLIFGMYDYLRLPLDVIHILITYCVDNGHRNLSYLEKVAIDWASNKIDSVEKAEEKINGMNELFREVKKALAVNNLNFKQRELISDWEKNLHMSQDLIVEACNFTMMNIGRPNFKYLESILETWNKKGIKTVQQAQNCKIDFTEKTFVRKNKFANFKQREWDFAKIEKLAQED